MAYPIKPVEYYLQKFEEKHGNIYDYHLIYQDYQGSTSKVRIICRKHGIFYQTPYAHSTSKMGCIQCQHETKPSVRSKEKWIELAHQIHNYKYEYNTVSDCPTGQTQIIATCPLHGDFITCFKTHIYRNRGCKDCSATKMSQFFSKPWEHYLNQFIKTHGNLYQYPSDPGYICNTSKIEIICLQHGPFTKAINKHIQGQGCIECSRYKSKGEMIIKNFLEKQRISFETQKTFKGLKSKNLLRFDFYIPDRNLAIEFDGRQHFEAVDWFGGNTALQETQMRDKLKNDFCLTNQISLLRIAHFEDIILKLSKTFSLTP